MSKTTLWAVWHKRDEKAKKITVKVDKWTDDEYKTVGEKSDYVPRYLDHLPGSTNYDEGCKFKFRTITPKAAARKYIRNNLFGLVARATRSCPCCGDDWTDDGEHKKLNWSLQEARKEYAVEIQIEGKWKL